jgi:hypothetical protein
MGRLRKGIWVFNEPIGEHNGPPIEGPPPNYQGALLDWLNRALAGSPGDRRAAERVGALMKSMNETTAEYLEAVDEWIEARKPDVFRQCKTFEEIASAFDYELELDVCPRPGFKKWHLAFGCVSTPSGDAYGRWVCLDKAGLEPEPLLQKWPEVPRHFNPECQAVNAVIFLALEGRLGTIKQCQIGDCGTWFAADDDDRRRFCPEHNSDDARRGTKHRQKQLAAAQKRARENAKHEEEKFWTDKQAGKNIRPGRRREK